MIEELNNKITSTKEVLSNMPKNNKKNKIKYLEYLSNLIEEYSNLKKELDKEINIRQDKIMMNIKKSTIDFSNTNKKIQELETNLLILNAYNTPYEKINLDKTIYEIMHFYKDDFEALNEDINSVINYFNIIGIELKLSHFCYSPYVKEYMSLILNKASQDKLKECFENIYWKCPNIIFQIALNFKYLYYKHEKSFNKYYQSITKELNQEKIIKEYNELITKKLQEEKNNINKLLESFLNKTLNITDYTPEKQEKYKTSLSNETIEIDIINKLYASLYEYQGYLNYSYIIKELITLYQEKDKYKNIYKNTLKEIRKIENKIFKINKQINRQEKYLKNEKKKNILLLKLNEQIDLVQNKYNELDQNKFYELISTLDDNTSYYDILNLAQSYYLNIRKIIEKEFDGITDQEIHSKISSLQEFLLTPNLTILKNIKIKENVDIALVISDRYKLLNLNITKDDIENNITSLMDTLEKLIISNIITTSPITYEDILFLYQIKNTINNP